MQQHAAQLWRMFHPFACVQVLLDDSFIGQAGVWQRSGNAAGQLGFTAQTHFILHNASCIFFSLWLPNALPQDASKYSIGLYSGPQMYNAVFNLDTTQQYNLSSCNGTGCNATAGVWMKQFNLYPSHEYWLLTTYTTTINASSNQRIVACAQVLTSGEYGPPCSSCTWLVVNLYIGGCIHGMSPPVVHMFTRLCLKRLVCHAQVHVHVVYCVRPGRDGCVFCAAWHTLQLS